MANYEKVRRGLLMYGFHASLILMTKLENEERYEDAALMFLVLADVNKEYNLGFKTIFDKDTIEDFRAEFWKLGFGGDFAVNNIGSYVKDLEKYLWE